MARPISMSEVEFLKRFYRTPEPPKPNTAAAQLAARIKYDTPIEVPPTFMGDIEAMCRLYRPDLYEPAAFDTGLAAEQRTNTRRKMARVLRALIERGWARF